MLFLASVEESISFSHRSINMIYCSHGFPNVERALHSRKSKQMGFWVLSLSVLFSIIASVFITDTDLPFLFFWTVFRFWCQCYACFIRESGGFPSLSMPQNDLWDMGNIWLWKCGRIPLQNHRVLVLFYGVVFMISVSISFIQTCVFKLSVSDGSLLVNFIFPGQYPFNLFCTYLHRIWKWFLNVFFLVQWLFFPFNFLDCIFVLSPSFLD